MAKLRSETRLEKAQGSPFVNSFRRNMAFFWKMKAIDFVKKNTIIYPIYMILAAGRQVVSVFQNPLFLDENWAPMAPRTCNIVPCYMDKSRQIFERRL